MMNYQRLSISTILIVLSLVHINTATFSPIRQAVNSTCPSNDICPYIPCQNGQCIEDKTIIECFQCQCSTGFTGKYCDAAITNPTGCNPPCLNGGQCQQIDANTSVCACPSDYNGTQCETSIFETHPCVTQPTTVCQNGGTCTINGASFLCNCPTGFSGINCQTSETLTTCDAATCGLHGTCRQIILPNNGGIFGYCACDSQWTGAYCDVNSAAVDCSTGYCQSGGTCVMNGNTPVCYCPSTHTGQQCETTISPLSTTTTTEPMTTSAIFVTTTASAITPTTGGCTANSCLNGGSCYNTGNSFICLCKPEYTGPTCGSQTPVTTPTTSTASGIDACSPNPCNNGGSCFKYSNSFVCVCTTQYTGQTCDTIKTPVVTTPSSAITCANQPCQNGATCYATSNSYFCYCGLNSNYSGKNCDTPKVSSDPSCPLNCSPGYCVNAGSGLNTYACMCDGTLTPTSCSSK